MQERDIIVTRMRVLLAILVLWDVALGCYAVFAARHFQRVILFDPQTEPLFIRGVGLYWLFAAYVQFLGFRSPTRNVLAVQLAIVFRLSAALIDSVEALALLPGPFYFFHYLLLFFVVMNVLIAVVLARWLRRLGLQWIRI